MNGAGSAPPTKKWLPAPPQLWPLLLQQLVLVCLVSALPPSGRRAANVLLMSDPVSSHMTMFSNVADELVKQGHHVTFILPQQIVIPHSFKGTNRRVLTYAEREDQRVDIESKYDQIVQTSISEPGNLRKTYQEVEGMIQQLARQLLMENEDLLKSLASLELDLAVIDGFFFTKYKYLVAHKLGLPIVTITDSMEPWVTRVPWLPSFVPLHVLPFTESMTFSQRIQNLMAYMALHFIGFTPKLPADILVAYSEYGAVSSLNEVAMRSLLWITTTDVVLDYAKPKMPNMIEAGGLTTKPAKALSPDWLKILESSSRGIVLVSFGSVASVFPEQITSKFLRAFASLQQTVIWRFNNKNDLPIPENVIISDWLPQNDLLAHPSIRVFITHCGNNGQFEAIYHGVPMVGIPLFGDQIYNAKRMEYKGYGVQLNINTFTPPELVEAITELMDNPSYNEQITRASRIFHDRPETPAERAASGIDHILQFGGEHLRSHAADMPLYQFLMLDVLALACVMLLLLTLTLKWLVKLIWTVCWRDTHQYKLKAQ